MAATERYTELCGDFVRARVWSFSPAWMSAYLRKGGHEWAQGGLAGVRSHNAGPELKTIVITTACFDAGGQEGRGRGRGGVGAGQDKHVPRFLRTKNHTRLLHARPFLVCCRVAVLEQREHVDANKVALGGVLRKHPPPSPVLETKNRESSSLKLWSARTITRFRGAGSSLRFPQNERLDAPRPIPVRP